jgi:sec-independent protein translocase protein TatA
MPVLALTPPGLPEMIVIGLIFVLLFGAKKLPELGGAIGKSIKSFKQGVDEGKDEEEPVAADAPPPADTGAQITRDGS